MMLVDLLAGSDRIATFLALLSRKPATGVTIVRYELGLRLRSHRSSQPSRGRQLPTTLLLPIR